MWPILTGTGAGESDGLCNIDCFRQFETVDKAFADRRIIPMDMREMSVAHMGARLVKRFVQGSGGMRNSSLAASQSKV
jgi:hypothetical protein